MKNLNNFTFVTSSCTKLQIGIRPKSDIFANFEIKNEQNHVQMLWCFWQKQMYNNNNNNNNNNGKWYI